MGRPKLKQDESTIRVGFSVNSALWAKFVELAAKRKIAYSELFRRMLAQALEGKSD